MGRFVFSGPRAADLLDRLLTQSIADLHDEQGRYCVMCREDGGILDDVICFRLGRERFFLVVNGATREKDWKWVQSVAQEYTDVEIKDFTLETAMIAVQGPRAGSLAAQGLEARGLGHVAQKLSVPDRFRMIRAQAAEPFPLLISTTGYTGEEGVEIYGSPEAIRDLWKWLTSEGVAPSGLGARDLLRLEMGYLLYGQDATEENDPFEARLGWTVDLSKPADFIGKAALQQKKEAGPKRLLTGVVLEGRGIPRTGFEVQGDRRAAGRVTSGSFSPWLKKPIALASIDADAVRQKQRMEIIIRGNPVGARIVKTPFIDRTRPPMHD
jgi:aminomethyltransferase